MLVIRHVVICFALKSVEQAVVDLGQVRHFGTWRSLWYVLLMQLLRHGGNVRHLLVEHLLHEVLLLPGRQLPGVHQRAAGGRPCASAFLLKATSVETFQHLILNLRRYFHLWELRLLRCHCPGLQRTQ